MSENHFEYSLTGNVQQVQQITPASLFADSGIARWTLPVEDHCQAHAHKGESPVQR